MLASAGRKPTSAAEEEADRRYARAGPGSVRGETGKIGSLQVFSSAKLGLITDQ